METTLQLSTENCGQFISHAQFGIDNKTGFLLREPLARLSPPFDLWEVLLADAVSSVSLEEDKSPEAVYQRQKGEFWRQRVRISPVLSTTALEANETRLQRAHLVLAFLVQFYVHSSPKVIDAPPIVVPKTLSIPLVAVSRCLGIAPILTFADTIIWNLAGFNAARPLDQTSIRFNHLFSGTEDERNFYATSAAVELRAAEFLKVLEEYHSLPNVVDVREVIKVAEILDTVKNIIDDLIDILEGVRKGCDPSVFYDSIRPWYNGCDTAGPTSSRWIYEGIPDSEKLDLNGSSAGQSPVIHALDIWLDIDHKLMKNRLPVPSEQDKRADHGFMERMRRYMPASHQSFLRYLENSPRPLRAVVHANPSLREHYNNAVLALKRLRDVHIRIVTLYIISMARRSPSPLSSIGTLSSQSDRGAIRGTGGADVALLLKAGRDATRRAML